jgi:hypothetical protein
MEYSKIFATTLHNIFLIWKKIILKNFNISEKNVISVELAKVLGHLFMYTKPPSSVWLLSYSHLIRPALESNSMHALWTNSALET